ncbi:hypothetical protein ACFL54_04120 [Planctomycetota bacterium]
MAKNKKKAKKPVKKASKKVPTKKKTEKKPASDKTRMTVWCSKQLRADALKLGKPFSQVVDISVREYLRKARK